MTSTNTTFLDLATVFFLLTGLFFMFVGALGIVRLPDLYHRMHAATKSVTLGITGLLIAAALALSLIEGASHTAIATRVVLVILFQFIANPVGAHLLAKAAHQTGCQPWSGTLSDDFDKDRP